MVLWVREVRGLSGLVGEGGHRAKAEEGCAVHRSLPEDSQVQGVLGVKMASRG